ncbi:hypothetical protein MRB53_030141 [Persea americana]|uniref:Uncharacterized protein n=1 Tax=Persea americana TaxID=3435 RepID=A0ACC2KKG3_PERAE|nr:hypothetical protein MRB53_030141 [Persea americana]
MATASSTFSKPLLPNNHHDHNNHHLILLRNAQSPWRIPTVRSPWHRIRPPIRSFSLPVSAEEAPATNPSGPYTSSTTRVTGNKLPYVPIHSFKGLYPTPL